MCSDRLFSFAFTITVYFQKLLKLLELVGLNGSTEVGLAALARGDELNGLRSPFCAQAILVYHTAFKFNLDPYNIDLDEVRTVGLMKCFSSEEPTIEEYFCQKVSITSQKAQSLVTFVKPTSSPG